MLILGIETSCDETSAAVVENGRLVLSNVVSSQIALHAPFGGVVPEIASRRHVEAIGLVVREAIAGAGIQRVDIDAIGVTYGPGLAGALLVGWNFARALALGLGCPLIPVNHLEGHLHSVWLSPSEPLPPAPEFPLVALIVSGGHTELILMRAHGEYDVLGRTLDDAAGEAFDKVARLLGLSYPGGPAIQRAAEQADVPVDLPRAWLPGTASFSFSGLKTAVLHAVHETATGRHANAIRGAALPRVEVAEQLSSAQVANLAAGFQESVVDVLARKAVAAAVAAGARSLAVVGGVAANRALRERMQALSPIPLYLSPNQYTTDNAAMIAGAAYFVPRSPEGIDIRPDLALV